LCPEAVASFYENLQALYDKHNYEAHQIWNCNESSAQAGKDGGGHIIAQRHSQNVHIVIPDQPKWLSVLSCINAKGEYLPNFYIFKKRRRTRIFLKKTKEKNAILAMQPKAWMTNYLFKA